MILNSDEHFIYSSLGNENTNERTFQQMVQVNSLSTLYDIVRGALSGKFLMFWYSQYCEREVQTI